MTSIELYESFLKEFPLRKLQTMTLDQYTNLNKRDSFCYWLEVLTADLGSIWGGSSYKFGIYKYNATPRQRNHNDGYKYDDEYAWLGKYGLKRADAFEKIKSLICLIAESANNGDFRTIDNIDFGDTYKWKIAFLYSNKKLVSVFNPVMLRMAATAVGMKDAKIKAVSEVQEYLLDLNRGTDIFAYSNELWNIASEAISKSRNTWVYAPGNRAYFWDDFYNDGVMGIGWDALEDLSHYKNQHEIQNELQIQYSTGENKLNDAKACYDFCNNIKIGDTIIVKKGLYEILGYGVVESDYFYDSSLNEFCHRRKVAWKCKGSWESPCSLPQKTLTKKDEKFKETIMNIIANTPRQYKDELIESLLLSKKQIILQGAPGTGKTYKTAELAVAICNPQFNKFDNRTAIMAEYNRLRSGGRIAFTTFHQSMDYEEFVEGLKPISCANGITFEPRAGLFKEICDRALLETVALSKSISAELEYDDIYDNLIEDIFSGKINDLSTKTGQRLIDLKVTAQKNIQFKGQGDSHRQYIVSKERLRKLYQRFETPEAVDAIKNIYDTVRSVIGGCHTSAYWAVLKYIVDHKNTQEEELIDIENLSDKEKETAIQTFLNTPVHKRDFVENASNYVLIIDEMNRGNISKILGELITLLEADKRIGAANELTAKLPYSQKEFGVPSNLYIIGTMNTADRSVGYIDYAIRRRFGFVPVKSDFSVIKDQIKDDAVKQAAGKLYDAVKGIMNYISSEFDAEDLMIGHSYFMADSPKELGLKLIHEIKPLLREYANDGIIALEKNQEGKYSVIEDLSI